MESPHHLLLAIEKVKLQDSWNGSFVVYGVHESLCGKLLVVLE